MTSQEISTSTFLLSLRRRRALFAMAFGIVFAGFLGMAFFLPSEFTGTAIIQVEQPEIPETITITSISSYTEELVAIVSQRVMSDENILNIIQKYGLYSGDSDIGEIESAIQRFRDSLDILPVAVETTDRLGRPSEVTFAFDVSYRYFDPELAAAVANEVADQHVKVNTEIRAEKAAGSADFLAIQANRLRDEIGVLDQRISNLERVSPALAHTNQNPLLVSQRYEQLDRELADTDRGIRAARERYDLLMAEVASVPRNRVLMTDGNPAANAGSRLAVAQQELIAAEAKYSAAHPDVVRLRAEVAMLSSEGGEAASLSQTIASRRGLEIELNRARQLYNRDHPDVVRLSEALLRLDDRIAKISTSPSGTELSAADNPEYLQLMARVAAAETEISQLMQRRMQIAGRIGGYITDPSSQAQYAALFREREALQDQYQSISQKLGMARISASVERLEKGQALSVIRRAVPPTSPTSPNRPLLSIFGLVLGILLGATAVTVVEALDTRIHSIDDLRQTQLPILSVIPLLKPGNGQSSREVTPGGI